MMILFEDIGGQDPEAGMTDSPNPSHMGTIERKMVAPPLIKHSTVEVSEASQANCQKH